MINERERFEKWLNERRGKRNVEIEALVLSMAEAYDAIQRDEGLLETKLDIIVSLASSANDLLRDCGTDLLAKLIRTRPKVAAAILEMARSAQSNARYAAMLSLDDCTPVTIVDVVLRLGLADKNARIRMKAADQAMQLDRSALLPELATVLANEQDEKARRTVEFSLRMLRDGFWIRPRSDGSNSLTVRTSDGVCNRIINDDELQAKGIDRLVRELRG